MTNLLEVIHEHALSIDFAMFILIGLVQVIVYPVFREIPADRFVSWHTSYCRRIAWFVLPLMIIQLAESACTCFFVGDPLAWIRFSLVFFAWNLTLFIAAPCHRKLQILGKVDPLIERLILVNAWRVVAWFGVLIVSFLRY